MFTKVLYPINSAWVILPEMFGRKCQDPAVQNWYQLKPEGGKYLNKQHISTGLCRNIKYI